MKSNKKNNFDQQLVKRKDESDNLIQKQEEDFKLRAQYININDEENDSD